MTKGHREEQLGVWWGELLICLSIMPLGRVDTRKEKLFASMSHGPGQAPSQEWVCEGLPTCLSGVSTWLLGSACLSVVFCLKKHHGQGRCHRVTSRSLYQSWKTLCPLRSSLCGLDYENQVLLVFYIQNVREWIPIARFAAF